MPTTAATSSPARPTQALTASEGFDFGPSVTQDENALVTAVVDDYKAGDMACNAAGVCSDPLTIFSYSQSSGSGSDSLAEQQLGRLRQRHIRRPTTPRRLPRVDVGGDRFGHKGSRRDDHLLRHPDTYQPGAVRGPPRRIQRTVTGTQIPDVRRRRPAGSRTAFAGMP